MGDDRILLLAPVFASDPAMVDIWPAYRALVDELSAFLPVDLFHGWMAAPTRRSVEDAISLLVEAITPEHHVVALGTAAQLLLGALSRRLARSLATAGSLSSAATLEAAGEADLGAAMRAVASLAFTPAQMIPVVMEGAGRRQIDEVIATAEASSNKSLLAEVLERFHETDFSGRTPVTIPALYLDISFPIPGADRLFELFKESVVNAQRDELLIWPMRMHEAAGGHELAGKIIPFIQSVIAEREQRA
ncbi:MAG: hypothetical protein WEB00_09280 [Dehalococcoidia bacterium]